MFNVDFSEILVVALVSMIVLDRERIPIFLDFVKNMYRCFMILNLELRKLFKNVGIEDLYEECGVEKVHYIVGEDGKLYPTYNVDNTKDESKGISG